MMPIMTEHGPKPIEPKPAAPPVRILVVEDDALVAAYIKDVLDETGFVVPGVASTAAEAFAFVGEILPPCSRRYSSLGIRRRHRSRARALAAIQGAVDLSLRHRRPRDARARPHRAAARLPAQALPSQSGFQRARASARPCRPPMKGRVQISVAATATSQPMASAIAASQSSFLTNTRFSQR